MFKEDLNLANLECCRQILSINILFVETQLTAFFSFVCACVLRCLFDGKKNAGVYMSGQIIGTSAEVISKR